MKLKLTFTLVMLIGICSIAKSQITGSAHDFSGEDWAAGRICNVCHTTHNSLGDQAPLWNHNLTTATFTLYTSNTFNGVADISQPNTSSKLCLSCHDGTVAIESFGGSTGATMITGSPLIGTDLSDDHPVSFSYTQALANADGGLYDPTTTNSTLGGTIQADLLFGDNLECASCHDVHNQEGNSSLLRVPIAGSQLCLVCHNK